MATPNRAQQIGLYLALTALAGYAVARVLWP
jgi:hypothetical protein